jgi:hypothetical protein
MSKVIRTALSLVISLVLFSALAMAQPGGKNADKRKNKEHHSRLAKVAFWRHHKGADKKAKARAPSKHAQAKKSQIKPASAKHNAGKNKTKPKQKAQDPKTAS